MIDQTLDCLTEADAGALPLHTVRPAALEAFLAGLPEAQCGVAARRPASRRKPESCGCCLARTV